MARVGLQREIPESQKYFQTCRKESGTVETNSRYDLQTTITVTKQPDCGHDPYNLRRRIEPHDVGHTSFDMLESYKTGTTGFQGVQG